MGDNIALIRFVNDWEQDGSDADTGLPRYRSVVKIIKSIPPGTEYTEVATEAHFNYDDYREAYEKFRREQKGRETTEQDGYPLVMWPAIGPADMMACFARDIYTVEQLARLASSKDMAVPNAVIEIAKRAQRMVDLARKQGKYETIISEIEGQVAAVREDNNQLRATIEMQKTQLEMLKDRMLRVA